MTKTELPILVQLLPKRVSPIPMRTGPESTIRRREANCVSSLVHRALARSSANVLPIPTIQSIAGARLRPQVGRVLRSAGLG
jgi:hypothetical protein